MEPDRLFAALAAPVVPVLWIGFLTDLAGAKPVKMVSGFIGSVLWRFSGEIPEQGRFPNRAPPLPREGGRARDR